ncbi:MAG: sulfurtransferase [Candidatus Dormibacteria bacterium]
MAKRKGLITAEALRDRLGEVDSGLAVVDMRERPDDGRPIIPGSVWVDLHDGFAQRRGDHGLDYDLPHAEELAATLGRLGIGPQTEVVFADGHRNRWATRAYWVLRYYRHPGKAWVLESGVPGWARAGLPATDKFARPEAVEYPLPGAPNESIRVTAEELRDGAAAGRLLPCDVRAPQEFTGEVALSGRGGHIPGASFVPWEACLDEESRFLPDERLEAVLSPFLAPGIEPVTYCQGGIRASLTWFAIHELLGRPARLYAASWEEWAQRGELPVEKGTPES